MAPIFGWDDEETSLELLPSPGISHRGSHSLTLVGNLNLQPIFNFDDSDENMEDALGDQEHISVEENSVECLTLENKGTFLFEQPLGTVFLGALTVGTVFLAGKTLFEGLCPSYLCGDRGPLMELCSSFYENSF